MTQKGPPWPEQREFLLSLLEEDVFSLRQLAKEIGLSPSGLSQLLENADQKPQERTLEKVRTWIARLKREENVHLKSDYVYSGTPMYVAEDAETARTLVIDPNLARRMVGKFSKDDVKIRVAIIREIEDVFLEAGVKPEQWPRWFLDLREEVIPSDRE